MTCIVDICVGRSKNFFFQLPSGVYFGEYGKNSCVIHETDNEEHVGRVSMKSWIWERKNLFLLESLFRVCDFNDDIESLIEKCLNLLAFSNNCFSALKYFIQSYEL